MATIELSLSSKTNKVDGKNEIMIRFFNGKLFNLHAKSGIVIDSEYFQYYIDQKKTAEIGIRVPSNTIMATKSCALKKHYILRGSGLMVTGNRRIVTPELAYHKTQQKKLDELTNFINNSYEEAEKNEVTGDWLKLVVDKYHHPEKYMIKLQHQNANTFAELTEQYILRRKISSTHTRVVRVVVRDVCRFEGFIRATDSKRKHFIFDINTITRNNIEEFMDYLRDEYRLQKLNPNLFKELLNINPNSNHACHKKLEERSENSVTKLTKQLKSIFNWAQEAGITDNRPFDGIRFEQLRFGKPYYISIDERNQIADFDFSGNKHLEKQRDIFVFQCFIGCRVSDLNRLTKNNIHNGILSYTPRKTENEGESPIIARIPLHSKAVELINKYKGIDERGRLFPFISTQKYNEAIKEIFTKVGITRMVEIRNPKTEETELVPINEVASSHMARRTFVGNAYLKVADPNIIGKMSGHVEGSTAFKRYRNIEDSTLQAVIDQIG